MIERRGEWPEIDRSDVGCEIARRQSSWWTRYVRSTSMRVRTDEKLLGTVAKSVVTPRVRCASVPAPASESCRPAYYESAHGEDRPFGNRKEDGGGGGGHKQSVIGSTRISGASETRPCTFRIPPRFVFYARLALSRALVIGSAKLVALSAPRASGRGDRDYKSVLGNAYDFALSLARAYAPSFSSAFEIARSVRPWDRDTAYRARHSIRAHSRRLCIYVARRGPTLSLSPSFSPCAPSTARRNAASR